MSRIGKLPIPIAEGVTVTLEGHHVTVTGPKGTLDRDVHPEMTVTLNEKQMLVQRPTESKWHKSLHGLTRTLLFNMVQGVHTGYTRAMEIIGVGYRIEDKGDRVVFYLGYSHPIVFIPPEGITIAVQDQTKFQVAGIDKELVGLVAAKIRSFRPPEPYKGKGIKYTDEIIRRKAGKAAV